MLFKNTLAQSGSLAVGYLFSFLLAPLMISRLGLDQFGIWAVTGSFATYAGLLDLGIGRSLIRFIAVYDAADREVEICECLGLGLLAVTLVGLLATAALAVAAPLLHDALGVLDTAQMRAVGIASVAIWSLNGYQGVINSVGLGKRVMVPPNIAVSIGLTVNFALSVAALLLSGSLVVYAIANAIAAAIALIPSFIAMDRLWGSPFWIVPSAALVREVLVYSVKDQVGWMADLVNFETDKVVIALVVDVRAAAIYEIASRVVMGVRSGAILTVSAMVPTAAAEIVARGREVIAPMYSRYTMRSCSIAFPLCMIAAVTAPFLLVTWLGRAPGDSELLVPFLTLAYMFNLSTGVGSTISLAAGQPGLVSVNGVIIAVANVALTLALAPFFGLWGVVGGTFLAVTLGSLRFTWRFLDVFDLDFDDFKRGALPTAALTVALAIPPALLALVVGTPGGRPVAFALLVLSSCLFLLPYWLLATRYDYLPTRLRFPGMRPVASTGTAV